VKDFSLDFINENQAGFLQLATLFGIGMNRCECKSMIL